MLKKVWIINHYATRAFVNKGGRHYYFAKFLKENGYEPEIFCASENHNETMSFREKKKKYIIRELESIPYIFIKTPKYSGNGIKRIINMYSFYRNLLKIYKKYIKLNGKPDIIFASSVHPLAVMAGEKIAKKLNIKCIAEVRDLWPEAIVEYGKIKRNGLIAKYLYHKEKQIYKRADSVIFTIEGAKDYIIERGWEREIDLDKIYYINNGIHLPDVKRNREENILVDADLESDKFKIVYIGSIRQVNNIKMLVDTAKLLRENEKLKFLIYGEGNERAALEKYCEEEKLDNIVFKGYVEKKYIPYILSKADLNVLNYQLTPILRFGSSQNKLFDYFASGKPMISNAKGGYNLTERYNCGIVTEEYTAESTAKAIETIYNMPLEERENLGRNALIGAKDYDFEVLTQKLINIIEKHEKESNGETIKDVIDEIETERAKELEMDELK